MLILSPEFNNILRQKLSLFLDIQQVY